MLEPTKTDITLDRNLSSTSQGDSKPIEISDDTDFNNQINQYNSLSAYASAESSPNNEYSLNNKSRPDSRLTDEPYFQKADESLSSINTYWGIPPATSLLIDEEDKLSALEHSKEKMSMSMSMSSFNSSKEMSVSMEDNKYKSLPVSHHATKLDKTLEEETEESPEPGPLKKELSESDIFKLNVVEGEDDLVSVDLQENASLKSDQLPEMSIPRSKSSTMSFIESIFSSKKTEDSLPKKSAEEAPKSSDETIKKSSLPVYVQSTKATSASSPNPECSPYKFLIAETEDTKTKKEVSTLQLENTNEESEDFENFVSLTRKDSEKHDPILSGTASQNNCNSKPEPKSPGQKTHKKDTSKSIKPVVKSVANGRSPSKSVSGLPSVNESGSSSKVDNLPASSHEFTMNLNFNLAKSVAATASGPVVVVDNSVSKSPVAKEHDKFTCNASTSSIHNDLKMILEEGKDHEKKGSKSSTKKMKESKSDDKLNKSKDMKPKSQRTKKDKKDTSLNSGISAADVSSSNMSPTSKTNDLNLIKMIMLMVENNKEKKSSDMKVHKKHQVVSEDGPSLIQLAKQNGRFKYNKEFLMQIKDQRASFIDQIQPEIFRAYCYCMNDEHLWDAEKYFDIVQFPGEFKKSNYNHTNPYNRSTSYNKANNNKYNNNPNKKFTPNTTYNNNSFNNSRSIGATPVSAANHQEDSPQPLQVPKNSPKFTDSTSKSKDQILASLGLKMDQPNVDKILLGLIKNEKLPQVEKTSNLMNILNKNTSVKTASPPNILDLLCHNKQEIVESPAHKYRPLILTAQELEMSQLSNQDKLRKSKLPNEISMNKLEELQQSMESNDSFAYRQLVKNLSNHPLTSANSINTKLEASLSKLQAKKSNAVVKEDKSKPSWQVNNDGTNMLKQLLNVTKGNEVAAPIKQKKQYNSTKKQQANKSGHLSMSHGSAGSSAGSSPNDSGMNKFPAVNPHEKPDWTEMNKNQIELVVANALNLVLNRSPMSSHSMSPTPKSPIEDLINKLNIQDIQRKQEQDIQRQQQELINNQHNHFNSLMSKINAQQQIKQDNDILKWFDADKNQKRNANQFSAHSLSEIEFMAMNKLY